MEEVNIYRIPTVQGCWIEYWLKRKAYLWVLAIVFAMIALGLAIGVYRTGAVYMSCPLLLDILRLVIVFGMIVTLISMWVYRSYFKVWRQYEIQLWPDHIVQRSWKVADVVIMKDEIDQIVQSEYYGLRILAEDVEKQIHVERRTERYDEIVDTLSSWHEIDDVRLNSLHRMPPYVLFALVAIGTVLLIEGKSPWLLGVGVVIFLLFTVTILYLNRESALAPRQSKFWLYIILAGLLLASIIRFAWVIVH